VVVTLDSRDAKASHTLTLSATPKAAGGFARNVEIITDSKDIPSVVIPVSAKVVDK
jgi:hypothetical protein